MKPFIIKSFRGGISDENNRGITGSSKFGYALDLHKRQDSLSCKQALLPASGATVTDLIKVFVNGADGSTYAFGDGGKIYARSPDNTWALMYTDVNGAIKGAAEWELDDGNRYMYWCTDTCVARKIMSSGNDDWTDASINWKTTLTSADYHTMRRACGKMMITNSNLLAMIGYDGSFTPSAFNAQPGDKLKCLEERDDYCIMGSYREDQSEQGHILSWITTALNWVQKKKIPVKGVNALINTEVMLIQGGTDGELFFSDFSRAVPLHAFVGGGQVNPSGVCIEDDIAMFGAYGGTYPGIWSYGRKRKNRPLVLSYPYRLSPTAATGSTIVELGALKTVDGVLLASWHHQDALTNEYGVDMVSNTTKATAIYESLEFDAGLPHLEKGFQIARIVMKPLPAGCSLSMKYKMNKKSSWVVAKLQNNAASFSETNAWEVDFLIPEPGRIYETQVTLTPNGNTTPEILAIVTFINDEMES